jgi:hypothetical protein
MSKLRAPTLALAFFALAAAASAQEVYSPYRFVETRQEAAISVGQAFTSTGQLGIGPRSGDWVAGRYSLEFGGALALESNLGLLMTERDVIDIRRDEGDQVVGRADANVASLDVRLRLNVTGHRTWHGLQPFVVFGGGLAFATGWDRTPELDAEVPPIDVYEFGTRFMANVGGGLNIHLSRRFALRADGVLNLWKIGTPEGYRDATRDVPLDLSMIPDDEWVSVKLLTVGLSWRF